MPNIPFPNVPQASGVPALPRSAKVPVAGRVALGAVQGALWRAFQVQTRWGIFDSKGKPLGDPSKFTGIVGGAIQSLGFGPTLSTNSFDFLKATKVSDFPVEKGGFANYNKVETPAEPVVVLAMAGSEADRTKFLDAIDGACKSTALFNVVTPEVSYVNYTIEAYRYARRNSQGATLLVVEISLKEIRQVSAQYSDASNAKVSDPKDPAATPKADAGKVQPKAPEISTLKKIADKLPQLLDTAQSYIQGALK